MTDATLLQIVNTIVEATQVVILAYLSRQIAKNGKK